jgi:predicted transcriptional regulator
MTELDDRYGESEDWQFAEINVGIAELDAGSGISHEDVATWLRSWGKPNEKKPPR